MSYDIVPESAPFSPEQRAWLNGFLAGILGTLDSEQARGGNAGSLAAAATTLLPPLGAAVVDAQAGTHASQQDDYPWHEPSLSSAERMELARDRPLPQRMMAAMAQLDCGSCGYVCKTYAEALANGSEKSLTLCSPGGNDTAKLLRQLQKEASSQSAHTNGAAQTNGTAGNPVTIAEQQPANGSRTMPITARLKSNTKLNGEASAKDTRHVAIDLRGSSLKYTVGDALGIFPTNCEQLVQQVCNAAGLAPQGLVEVDGRTTALQDVLSQRCLRTVPLELIERIQQRIAQRPKLNGAVAMDAVLIEHLQHFADSDEFAELDLYEFLTKFNPLDLTAEDLIETLEPLRPRLYSIASSQSQYPHEVHLTVGRVEEMLRGRPRKGVASTMLADRLQSGAALRVFVQPSHGFTIPADPAADMIMVGPGTGIAPFVAFLQQRQFDRATGRNWLFFGDQKRDHDFLYKDQLTHWRSEGLLTRLDLAFSRDMAEKVYVQNRMLENGAELFRWLESGSYFFVCGDAKRMARDVERALLDIIIQHGGLSADDAKNYVANMKRLRRYVCDVY